MTSIQRIIDRLADDLSRPTAVDDPDFRLLYYSPQRGPLDQVRIDSILNRDSPAEAKEWVTRQGVGRAERACRVRGAPELGLFPRACAPIRHDRNLLGYLWVIDADETLGEAALASIAAAAAQVAPLLYRMRTLDVLDRRDERETMSELLAVDPGLRSRAAERLETRGVLATAARPRVVVVEADRSAGRGFADADEVGLEAALERTRSVVAESEIAYLTDGMQGVVLLVGSAADAALHLASRLRAACEQLVPDRRWVVGIGSVRERLPDAHASFAEAVATVRILAYVPALGDVLEHADLGVYATIARLSEDDLTDELVPDALRRLIDGDEEGELTATLECYLDMAGEVVPVARQLHVHRSTVYARLQRIEQIGRVDLRDGADRLTLHFGLAMARVVGLWPTPPID